MYATPPASGLRITWMGHSSTLVEIDGVRILLDPVWDERASPFSWIGPRRFFQPPIRLEDLPPLDAVLVSHDHYDHLSAGTVRQLARLQPKARWVTSLEVGAVLRQFGVRAKLITELDWTEAAYVEGAGRAACARSLPCPRGIFPDAAHRTGSRRCGRRLCCAARRQTSEEGQRHVVYYGGGFGLVGRLCRDWRGIWAVRLTMLEIGAFNEMWRQIHLGPDGAVRAFQAMGGNGLLMPIHWGLFDLALHAWRWPIERMLELADADGLKLWSPSRECPPR